MDALDCARSDPAAWQFLAFQSEDGDADGHFVNAAGKTCAGADLPPRYAAGPIAGETDCKDDDATRWQVLPHDARDADLDGHSITSAGEVCSGASLPAGYLAGPATGPEDCNDASSSTWRLMTIYADADGDKVGAGAGSVACVGTGAATGFSLLGYDPADDPADPDAASISALDLPSWLLTTPRT